MNIKALVTSAPRDSLIKNFLNDAGWKSAERSPIPGDASFRRYERIRLQDRTCILMDAPPDKEDVAPFIKVSDYLVELDLRAPRIIARDVENGFLLLEDLGNDLYSRVLETLPESKRLEQEKKLYQAATLVLAELYQRSRKATLPDLPTYSNALLHRELALFTDWYLPAILEGSLSAEISSSFQEAWEKTLKMLPPLPLVPTLRDYHADNLLVIPGATGKHSVGLLDFQDAVIGSPAYDMVSFLEDARRDVSQETVSICKELYVQNTQIPIEAFDAAYAILGAQRNCKIIGIFTRLGARDGKYRYQKYLPRVWSHLHRDLLHPALAPVSYWIKNHIPVDWQHGAPPFADKL